jgi:hypothetical protein
MNHATHAAIRRFPLLGRPRPLCPPLSLRIREINEAPTSAPEDRNGAMADAAHTLNKAALIVSDCGVPHHAERLCWTHIDAYRQAQRPLTIIEARYLLEPVLNLARLKMRADQGKPALELLEAMHAAVNHRQNLTVGDAILPTADLAGTLTEWRELREWTWLQLVNEGVRIHAIAGRWGEAIAHAETHRGVGLHLMEGRQAAIISAILQFRSGRARSLLHHSKIIQPWERDIAACLYAMSGTAGEAFHDRHLNTLTDEYRTRTPEPGYASYHARLGLTIVALTATNHPEYATDLLDHVAATVTASADGYAARELVNYRDTNASITEDRRTRLDAIVTATGLGNRPGTRGPRRHPGRPWTDRGGDERARRLVEAELVALRVGHNDVAAAHRWLGLETAHPGRSQRDKPLAVGFEGCHPFVTLQPRSGTYVEMHSVFGNLVFWNLLKEDPRPVPVRVLDCRSRVALFFRHADPVEEVVPRGQRIGTLWQLDSRRAGVYVAKRIAPERRQRARVVGVERDLYLTAHQFPPRSKACTPEKPSGPARSRQRNVPYVKPVVGSSGFPSGTGVNSRPGSSSGVRRISTSSGCSWTIR